MIGDDWEQLVRKLGLKKTERFTFTSIFKSEVQKRRAIMFDNQEMPTWFKLKDALDSLDRTDIIKEVTKQTYLTEGI